MAEIGAGVAAFAILGVVWAAFVSKLTLGGRSVASFCASSLDVFLTLAVHGVFVVALFYRECRKFTVGGKIAIVVVAAPLFLRAGAVIRIVIWTTVGRGCLVGTVGVGDFVALFDTFFFGTAGVGCGVVVDCIRGDNSSDCRS